MSSLKRDSVPSVKTPIGDQNGPLLFAETNACKLKTAANIKFYQRMKMMSICNSILLPS